MGFGKHELPNKGKTDSWYTPKWITDDLGEFDFDPCSNSTAPYQHAITYVKNDIGECGLEREWKGSVWMNPPYSKNKEFCKRFKEHGNGIALVFARTETQWFQYLWESDAMFFFKGRLCFVDEEGNKAKGNAGAPSVLVAFGSDNVQRLEKFSTLHNGKLIKLVQNIGTAGINMGIVK